MSEVIALKLELQVDSDGTRELDGQSRICNHLYNHLLEVSLQLKEEYRATKNENVAAVLYTKRGLRNLIPAIKLEKPFLKVVHSSPLKNAALRVSEAIQAYQKSRKGQRKGATTGWPRFRNWKRAWFSLFYDEPNKGFKVEDGTLKLSLGMGEDRKQRSITLGLQDADLLKDKTIHNLRITCELGKYYAIFAITHKYPDKQAIHKVIALDPNHKNLAYGVDTNGNAIEIESPGWLKNYNKRLDELTSKRDRCNKKAKVLPVLDASGSPTGKEFTLPSKKWKHYDNIIKKVLLKRREQTKTFMYTAANALFKKYDCVSIGDYTPHGDGDNPAMRRAMNNCSLNGRWKHILSWVASKSGKTYMEFDEKNTTRTCFCCQSIHPGGIPVEARQWQCFECQTVHIRDENAAINGLRKTLRDLSTKYEGEKPSIVSGSDPDFVKKRWAWSVFPSGVRALRGKDGNQFCNSRKLNRESGISRSEIEKNFTYV